MTTNSPFAALVSEMYSRTQSLKKTKGTFALVDGYKMSIADVVSVARFSTPVKIDDAPEVRRRVDASVEYVQSKTDMSIYGLNTGFGGSADIRTLDPAGLQVALIETLLAGVLPPSMSLNDPGAPHSVTHDLTMADDMIRGGILIRINSLVRGHSGVRQIILDAFAKLLNEGITPVVPLRGSISASGDIAPLGYCVAAITGHPDVRVKVNDKRTGTPTVVSALVALQHLGMPPIVLGPKEGLGLINGTAFSASAASLVIHDSHYLAILAMATTAMTVEAMMGRTGSFHPFIHDIARPHPGQVEAAKHIRCMLAGSSLTVADSERKLQTEIGKLIQRQDRYALRSSAQWMGPYLEDLAAAHKTIMTELNSTTDNPLIDAENHAVHHCGNFQAMAVTSAVEKVRLALQSLGKMSFAQATELINVSMNRGLGSCLAAEEPSTDYHCKGLDIAMASYCAELGYLANPVSTHVQSAEQHNQAINSMALVSARKTIEAIEVLTMLLASHLYAVCQALDLRVIELLIQDSLTSLVSESVDMHLGGIVRPEMMPQLSDQIIEKLLSRLEHNASMDTSIRYSDAFSFASTAILEFLSTNPDARENTYDDPISAISRWREASTQTTLSVVRLTRDQYQHGAAAQYMGSTRALYEWVRNDLGVRMRKGDVYLGGPHEPTIGTGVSKIYAGLRSGQAEGILVSLTRN